MCSRRANARFAAIALIAVLCGLGCQTQRPAGSRTRGLVLTDVEGFIEAEMRRRTDEHKSKVDARRQKTAETLYEESIGLEVDGFVYHPNLLEFTIGGLFGLIQNDFEDTIDGLSRRDRNDGTKFEFDLNGDVFKKKDYPGNVRARRYRSLTPRPFLRSLETTTEDYGLQWRYVHPKFPTSLELEQIDIELDPLLNLDESGKRSDRNLRFETGYVLSDFNVFSLLYDHKSYREDPFDLEYDSDEGTLEHDWDFGDQKQHELLSTVDYLDQTGSFDVDRLMWRERLRMEHTENLNSLYRFDFIDRKRGNRFGGQTIDERSYALSATLEHRLYKSLVTRLHAFGQTQDYRGRADIDRFGGDGSLRYRKQNPLGELFIDYAAKFQREDRSGGAAVVEVIDESHSFQDPAPVVLKNTNIELGSLVVTALDGVTFYFEERDFTVFTIGNDVELERVPTGQIADGQTVLIDYLYNLGGDLELDTVTQNFGIRQNFFFGLRPYYRLEWQHQSFNERGDGSVIPEDISAHIIGIEFNRWKFNAQAEYEKYYSTTDPFDAVRLSAGYSHRFRTGASGTVRASWDDVSYGAGRRRDTTFFTIEGRYRHPLTDRLIVEGTLRYRREDDTVRGNDEGFDFDCSLEWKVRKTELRVTFELGRFEDNFSENDSSTLYVLLRRRF